MRSISGISGITNRFSAAIPFASSMAVKCPTSSARCAWGTLDSTTPSDARRSRACWRISHTGPSAYRLALVMNSQRSEASRNL